MSDVPPTDIDNDTDEPDDITVIEIQRKWNPPSSTMRCRSSSTVRSDNDGLKPVHRRILWGMFDQGLPDRNFVECARVSGDVAARFHPHGTSAIYGTLARSQPFSFVTVDRLPWQRLAGDPPAADRYTECRLGPLAMQMLADIDEDTVDFADNYSAEFQEPTVLPARYNLLVNGVQGIAVGMATNDPRTTSTRSRSGACGIRRHG